MSKANQKRIVMAPQPVLASASQLPANRIISVELDEHEAVEWQWTSLPNGSRYVSGYTILEQD